MHISALDKRLVGEAWNSPDLNANLEALCGFGSRFPGTNGEVLARDFIASRLADYGVTGVDVEPFEYLGWKRGTCRLTTVLPFEESLDAFSLVYSPSTFEGGLRGTIVDVGMGTDKDFDRKQGQIAGKIVLCSSASPAEGKRPHRREKFGRAVNAGAIGFIYMRHLPGGLAETGSLRPGRLAEIPGVAVSYETGMSLKRLAEKGIVEVALLVQNRASPTTGWHVSGTVPGSSVETVVVGAHYDGHDISQAAMDNASGVCILLEMARLFASLRADLRRSIRLVAFDCEELGVLGSTQYVESHHDELNRNALMMNLDSAVGGGEKGFSYAGITEIEGLLARIAEETGYPLKLVETLETASDNFPFFMAGIPAINLRARDDDRALGRGFGHTSMDTVDKVNQRELKESSMVAARVLLRFLQMEDPLPHRLSADEIKTILKSQDLEQPLRAQGKWKF